MDASSLINLQRRVNQYKEVLVNTDNYRKIWRDNLCTEITGTLENLIKAVGLEARVEIRSEMANLEAIVLSLGTVKSGVAERLTEEFHRDLVKHNGALIYQQLFNGKIIVLINYPYIENYGEPRPPKTIAIYRPEELREPYFIRHLEEFIQEVTNWEDFDDDEPNKKIGFHFNFPGGDVNTPPVKE